MKVLITVISSLLVGLALASTNFSPIHELHSLFVHKKRILAAAGMAVTGYVLILTGMIVGIIEGALQSDAQGFMMWSSLFSVAVGLAMAGFALVIVSRLMVPTLTAEHQSLLADLNRQFNLTENLEKFIKAMSENAARPGPAAPPTEKFTEVLHERVEEITTTSSEPMHH
jgi:hypothetical protein